MAADRKLVRLGDVSDLLTGFPFQSDRYIDDPAAPRLLRGDNVAQGALRWDGAKRWPSGGLDEYSAYQLRQGDVILAMDRPWIEAGLKYASVQSSDLPCLLVQRVARLRGTAQLDTGFLKHVLASRAFTDHVLAVQTGTAVPHISSSQIKSFEFELPPLSEQRAITHILGSLDDKIELNRQMNETLEAMARALFNSWFLALDWVPGTVTEMIGQGVLEIGDGYRAKNTELGEPGLPFIRAGDLDNGFDTSGADVLRENIVPKVGNKISRAGDVAFTSKGTIGRFARVTDHTPRFVYSPQVCFWRSLDPKRLEPAILYYWMRSEHLRQQITAVAGQTDMAPYVSLRDQRMMEIPIFPESQHNIASQLESFLSRQSLASQECKTLGGLRDVLLPRLLSGELRVQEAERVVAEAAHV